MSNDSKEIKTLKLALNMLRDSQEEPKKFYEIEEFKKEFIKKYKKMKQDVLILAAKNAAKECIIEDFKNSGYKYTNDCKNEKTKKYNKTQEIVCLNTGEIFKNARECCIKYPSADNSIILKCCKNIFVSGGNHCCGKDDSNNNLYWCYLGDYSEFKDKNINDIQKYFSSLKHTASRKVVCLNNNIVFDSCMDAAKFCNISVQSICDNLKGRTHTTKNGNYVFKYYDDTLNNL